MRGYYLFVIIWVWVFWIRFRKWDFYGDLELEILIRNYCKDRYIKIIVNIENIVNKNLVGFKFR